MTIILKKGFSSSEIDRKLKDINQIKSQHDFKKYVGVINLEEIPTKYQKKIRNEWD